MNFIVGNKLFLRRLSLLTTQEFIVVYDIGPAALTIFTFNFPKAETVQFGVRVSLKHGRHAPQVVIDALVARDELSVHIVRLDNMALTHLF